MGNFYLDMWRAGLYVFLPLSFCRGVSADGRRRADDL